MAIVPAAEIHVPKGTMLYFSAHGDGDVYALDLSQEAPRRVYELGSRRWYDRLQVTTASVLAVICSMSASAAELSSVELILDSIAKCDASRCFA